MKPKLILGLLAAVLGVGLSTTSVLATPGTVTTTKLAQARFADIDLKAHAIPASLWRARIRTHGSSDVYVVDNKLAAKTATTPGGTTGSHSHPGPSLILVVAGTVTNYEGGDPVSNYAGGHPRCTPQVYTAGTGFVDPGGDDVHMLVNEGSDPAETIAVQLLPQDAARRIDAPDPGNCPH